MDREESRKATLEMLERCGRAQAGHDKLYPHLGDAPVEPEMVSTEIIPQTDYGVDGAIPLRPEGMTQDEVAY